MTSFMEQHPFWSGAILLSTILSLRIFLGMWMLPHHKETRVVKRLFWSFVVMIPFAGPLFYGGFYRIPKPHRDGGCPLNPAVFHYHSWR